MSLISDVDGLVRKYASPLVSYVYSLVGLTGAGSLGAGSSSVSTNAVVALGPAVVHLGSDIVNELRGLVKTVEADVKAVEAAAAPAAQDTVASA